MARGPRTAAPGVDPRLGLRVGAAVLAIFPIHARAEVAVARGHNVRPQRRDLVRRPTVLAL
jgi:hypothetical protein